MYFTISALKMGEKTRFATFRYVDLGILILYEDQFLNLWEFSHL